MGTKFLNDYLLNRLGCQLLMYQYLACKKEVGSRIIDSKCDAIAVCKKAAVDVQDIAQEQDVHGRRPIVYVEGYAASGENLPVGEVPSFSYIPSILAYVVRELLKNSCR